METLNDRIKQLRKERGLTQGQLADILGVTDKAVSKWEVGESNPDISLLPGLAETLGTTVDYLLTGKSEAPIALDDMDAHKRALHLIKKDDAKNFEKYGLVNSYLLFSKEAAKTKGSWRENIELRDLIVASESKKIFSLLADALLEDLKKRKYEHMYQYYSTSAACLVYDYLDEFVKLCALTGKVELLDFIKFKSFGIGSKENEQYYQASRYTDFFMIKQETLDLVLGDKRVPQEIFDYVTTYNKYTGRVIHFPTGPADRVDGTNMIRMADNVVLSLYKADKIKAMEAYLESMKEEAEECCNKALENCNDYGWRSRYHFGAYGYMFYHNGNGSVETDSCCGKITPVGLAISYAIEHKDKKTALRLVKYNEFIKDLLDKLSMFKDKPNVHIVSNEAIDKEIERMNQEELYQSILADKKISDRERRRKLFAMERLSISEVLEADDYELFVQFPIEMTSKVSVSSIARVCNDVRFYIFAVNVGQEQESLDTALAEVTRRLPERYDILDVLLSAGAQVTDNPSMTAILKQNVLILANQKAAKAADVKVEVDETKEDLVRRLKKGEIEHVIVNLAFQLEQKLKVKYGKAMQLLDMINAAHNDGLINDLECSLLHNLRKSRNMIMHEGSERGHYTQEVAEEWIKVVYKL